MEPDAADRSRPSPAATGWLGRWGLFPIVAVTALVVAAIAVPFVVRNLTSGIGLDAPTSGPSVVSFRWHAVPHADAYRVQVYSPDGSLVWTSPVVHEPSVDWPRDASRDAAHFWRVTALRGDDVLAESPLTKFTVDR